MQLHSSCTPQDVAFSDPKNERALGQLLVLLQYKWPKEEEMFASVWKPEVVDAPIRSENPPQPATSISHLGPRAHIKKKRSPSSWRRSKQWLKNFLEKKSCQERQEYATAVIGRSQESPAAPISAPQPLAPLRSQSSDGRKDADRSPEDAGFKGGKELYQSGDPEHEDDRSLGEVLQGSRNIVYEALKRME